MVKWPKGKVTIGDEKLYDYIKGKKVALMMNTTAVDNNGKFIMDTIFEEKIADIAFFFSMEHGVRGNFQPGHTDTTDYDIKTGVKAFNLYNYPGRIPPVDLLKNVDMAVFCAQDIGLRHWTFTTWLFTLVSSCAEAGTEVVILDQPNPLRGDIIEGEISQKYIGKSFVTGFNGFAYPLRHGMTVGEIANMYNEQREVGAKITVIKMDGWKRDMWFDDTGLLWMPPTPNMATAFNAINYATVGLLQGADISLGRNTTTPYQYVGAEHFDGEELAYELNSRDLPGVFFMQRYYEALTGPFVADDLTTGRQNRLCDGVMFYIFDKDSFSPTYTQLHIFDALIKLYHGSIDFESDPWHARNRTCNDDLLDLAKEGKSVLPLIDKWKASSEEFKKLREKYLLY